MAETLGSRLKVAAIGFLSFGLCCAPAPASHAGADVLTQRNDSFRSGLNLTETTLNTSNVAASSFGMIFSRSVDDEIYAQPLVVSDLDIPGKGQKNVVYVATVNGSLYAFDADAPNDAGPLWHRSFLSEGSRPPLNTDMVGACGGDYQDFSGHIGIISTPVIDRSSETIYLVARSVESGRQVQRLHAVSIIDGSERMGSPVEIAARMTARSLGDAKSEVTFDALHENQRAGLLLLNGTIYIAWAGHCDWPPYYGWILGYDAKTFAQKYVYNAAPEGAGGAGIWQSGTGLVSDGTYIYAVTGNALISEDGGTESTINRGQSVLKLEPSGSELRLMGWFTPHNYKQLDEVDDDFGSAGLTLIPGSQLAVAAGKGGDVYVLNTGNLGGISRPGSTDDNTIQYIDGVNSVYGTPLFWKGPAGGRLFVWPAWDSLKSYRYLGGNHDVGQEVFQPISSLAQPYAGFPGGALTLSASGDKPGSAIVWASAPLSGDANVGVHPGVLRAFDAEDVSREIWNSQQNAKRDSCGGYPKFASPTVANGKVYYGSFSKRLCVYGLLKQ